MRNYPALKCYTSKTQYEMLKELQGNPSISNIVTTGRSKTLGSIFRSRWVEEREYTDDKGVVRTGWFLTADGENAVTVYEQVEERKAKDKAETQEVYEKFCKKYHEALTIEIQWRKLKEQADRLEKEAEAIAYPKFGHLIDKLKRELREHWGVSVKQTAAEYYKQYYLETGYDYARRQSQKHQHRFWI